MYLLEHHFKNLSIKFKLNKRWRRAKHTTIQHTQFLVVNQDITQEISCFMHLIFVTQTDHALAKWML
mgnify:CR=1 FL=1